MDLRLQPGESAAVVTAEAEDAAHRHHDLIVEYVAPVPHQEWLSEVVLKLNGDLGDVGDVLVGISYGGVRSNRVRVAIGHLGGGPADDNGAGPTPVKPFTLGGLLVDDYNQGLEGVEVTLTDEVNVTTSQSVSSSGGRFSFAVAPGHSFTLKAASTQFFNFPALTVAAIANDQKVTIPGIRRTYSITGKLNASHGNGAVPGASVNLSGPQPAATTSDNNGNYRFTNVPAGGPYLISVASTPYYNFSAESLVLTEDQVVDFTGDLRFYTVSGHSELESFKASGLVILVGGSQTVRVTSDDNGNYSVSLPAGGNYTLTPSQPFWFFIPGTLVLNNLHSDQTNAWNFSGFEREFTISGKLVDQENHGLGGLTVDLAGRDSRTTTTDNTGYYEFTHQFAGYSYTVTPVSTVTYKFTEQSIAQLPSDLTLNFTGLRRLILKGTVQDPSGNGLGGITVTSLGTDNGTTTTAADGSYSLPATATGNYTITPSIGQGWYTFAPATVQLNNLAGSEETNFAATLLPIIDPSYVLEFDGTPKTVDYGPFWQEGVNLGHFFWEFWAMPGSNAGATYLFSDGYGGAHALLFGVGSFNTSEPTRYQMLGNIFDGVKFDNYFGSDQGPSLGEWAHLAVGWDGQSIITYFDGVPVGKTPFYGPRRTPGTRGGGGRLLIGGSDHSNWDGRIAQVRGYEGSNPRENSPSSVEGSFAPETIFSVGGNLLSYYFRSSPRQIADLSQGYGGVSHQGFLRGTTTGIINYCDTCPPPRFVVDPTAPNFATGTASPQSTTPSPPLTPDGALVFDSFSRKNSTYIFGGHGGLGSTEAGTAGTQVWQTDQQPASPQPFGILDSIAVLLGNDTALAWVSTGTSSGNVEVRVDRCRGSWGSGINTGLVFRVVDARNFFFAYTSYAGALAGGQLLKVGYYQDGNRVDLATDARMPPEWTTLRVITTNDGDLNVYAEATLVYSTSNPLMKEATGAGLYNDSFGLGLVNRWDNFTVFNAP